MLLQLGLYIQASFSCATAQGTELCTKETSSPTTVPSFQMYYSAQSIIQKKKKKSPQKCLFSPVVSNILCNGLFSAD